MLLNLLFGIIVPSDRILRLPLDRMQALVRPRRSMAMGRIVGLWGWWEQSFDEWVIELRSEYPGIAFCN